MKDSPRRSHRSNHDPHHSAIGQQCNARWNKKTRSLSTAEGLQRHVQTLYDKLLQWSLLLSRCIWEDGKQSPCSTPQGNKAGRFTRLTAALLIRIVSAIIVIVTLPATRHTAIVLATKLVWFTGAIFYTRAHTQDGQVLSCILSATDHVDINVLCIFPSPTNIYIYLFIYLFI